MATAEVLPPHAASIGNARILGYKEHWPAGLELPSAAVAKDPMLHRANLLCTKSLPVPTETMLDV